MSGDSKTPSSSSEAEIENEILVFLSKIKGGYFWKNTSGGFFDGAAFRRHSSPFAIRGTSDIIGLFAGRFVALEVKDAKGKATKEQLAFIEKVRSRGGVGAVVRSIADTRAFFLESFDVFLE